MGGSFVRGAYFPRQESLKTLKFSQVRRAELSFAAQPLSVQSQKHRHYQPNFVLKTPDGPDGKSPTPKTPRRRRRRETPSAETAEALWYLALAGALPAALAFALLDRGEMEEPVADFFETPGREWAVKPSIC